AALGVPARAPRAHPAGEPAGGAATAQPPVRGHGLAYTYPDGTALNYGEGALEGLPGGRGGILGANGAGQRTPLLPVLGLLKAQLGEVRVFGEPADALRPEQRAQIAALLQQVDEQIIGPTVWDDVAFTPRNLGLDRAEVARLTEAALRRMDVWHLRQKVPHALSAGGRGRGAP